ncbi:MAG: Sapep family Mn(2+)-dependent dipeptidase [Clostridium sp.]|uniref:Sapep family Mn(2+)-dependent dipeptidase n=1 Tax=Clostridium sp. TaxID=1506 RepID=UPI003EE70E81
MFKERVRKEKESLLKSIDKVVRVNSIEGIEDTDAPFGEEPKKVLEVALEIGKEMGFKTKNINNAIGYVEYGEGEEYVCALGHLDIVPVGEGWDYDPLRVTIEGDKIYGRGVLDNKGPIMSCLYGLKIIKDMNLKLSKRIRIIFGTNEETGFKDIPYYLKEEKLPIMGFTPDCKFPVIYGERGILDLTIWSEIIKEKINVDGKFVNNVVSSNCEINIDGKIYKEKGQSAPGNTPEVGENAVTKLCNRLKENEYSRELKEFLNFIVYNFHENHNLDRDGVKFEDNVSGKLIINPYKIEEENRKLGVSVVFRYPIMYKYEDILERVYKISKKEYEIKENRRMDSVLFDKDSEMLNLLKESYEKVTGLDGTPVTTTGGTYAKVFKNIVAFGPSFPGQKGIAHNKNEYMNISDLMLGTEIYTEALYNLAK